ncbi:MAG: hypothetical protein WCH01_22625 [Methylococcaceae bacterium]
MQGSINSKRLNLLNKYSKKLAQDIVNQCELQIRQLLAIFPDKPMTIDGYWKSIELGNVLVFALDHDSNGNVKRVEKVAPRELINNIYDSLGLSK